jgi:hypothetical protein
MLEGIPVANLSDAVTVVVDRPGPGLTRIEATGTQ